MKHVLNWLARCVKWPFTWMLLGVNRRSRNWLAIQDFTFRQHRRQALAVMRWMGARIDPGAFVENRMSIHNGGGSGSTTGAACD